VTVYKSLPWLFVPTIIILIIAGVYVEEYDNEPWSQFSVILASIAIALAVAIFAFQQIQSGKLQEILEDVHKSTVNVNLLLGDKRKVYADTILHWWLNFEFNYKHVFNIYNKFIVRREGTFEHQENTRKNILENYTRYLQTWRPQITPMMMVEVFGKSIADKWSRLISRSSMDANLWQPSTEDGLKLLLKHFQDCYAELGELRDLLLEYASEDVKSKVKKRMDESTNETE